MPWWVFVLVGNFLIAVALLVDKMLLGEPEVNPRRYTMLAAISGIFGIVLLPLALFPGEAFTLVVPSFKLLAMACASAIAFFTGLYFFYVAIQRSEASRTGPVVGALNAVFTVVLAVLFLGDQFNFQVVSGIGFLLVGGILLAVRKVAWAELGANARHLLFAGFCFAMSSIILKQIFLTTSFLTGQLLVGAATFLIGVWLLLTSPRDGSVSIRSSMRNQFSASRATVALFAFGKSSGAIGGVLISFAISSASVALVTASSGVQYAFVFLLAVLLSVRFPRFLKEDLSGTSIAVKLAGVMLVGVGIAFVAHRV